MLSTRNQQRIAEHTRKRKRRCEIIELVRQGHLHARDAAKLAEHEGLSQFENVPDPSQFPIMDEVSWTIEMAVAWIIWRDLSKVVRYFSPYRQNVTHWKPILRARKPPAFELETRSRADLAAVERESGWVYEGSLGSGLNSELIAFQDARKDLWLKLQIDELKGRAIDSETMRPIEIPSFEWSYLEVAKTDKGPTELAFASTESPRYKHVTFSRKDVLRLWPEKTNLRETVASCPSCSRNHQAVARGDTSLTPSSPAASEIRKAIHSAARFFLAKGFLMWTQDEAQKELRLLLGATRGRCMPLFAEAEIIGYFPRKRGRRGSHNPSRNNELDQFRQFFESANKRK